MLRSAPATAISTSPDGHAALIVLTLAGPGEDHVEEVIEVVEGVRRRDGFETAITGEFSLDRDLSEVSERDLQNGELRSACPPR